MRLSYRFALATLVPVFALTACQTDQTVASSPATLRKVVADQHNLAALARFGISGGTLRYTVAPDGASAIIDNGVIQLGVRPTGDFNVPNAGPKSTGNRGTTAVGIRLFEGDSVAEGTAEGCLCEGWGASADGFAGMSNVAVDGDSNVVVESFTQTDTSAISVVGIPNPLGQPWLRVTQDYEPWSGSRNLYINTVTIENVSDADFNDVRYTRIMDWDIPPTAFEELVTIEGWGAKNLIHSDNDGFDSANPLREYFDFGETNKDTWRFGPRDQGAVFDFSFGKLAKGQKKVFHIYYGAAPNRELALAALNLAKVEVYSLGEPSAVYFDGPPNEDGAPNTFMFGFDNVNGETDQPPPTPAPTIDSVGYTGFEGTPLQMCATGTDPLGGVLSFSWDLFNNRTIDGTGDCISKTYLDNGVKPLTIYAANADTTVSLRTTATIANLPPQVLLHNVYEVEDGAHWHEHFIGTFSDPGVNDRPWRVTVAWGDGTSSIFYQRDQTLPVILDHIYPATGTYKIRYSVTDKDKGRTRLFKTVSFVAGPTAP